MIRKTLIVLIAVLATGCATTERRHVEFDERKDDIKTLAILPIDVSVSRIGFTGSSSPAPELENSLPEDIRAAARQALADAGIEAVPMDHLQDDPDYLIAVQNTREAVEELLESLASESAVDDAMSTAAHVDLQLTGLSDYIEADALALIDYAGFSRTGGNHAKMLFISMAMIVGTGQALYYQGSGSAAIVTLIDARDGALLWSNHAVGPLTEQSVKAAVSKLTSAYGETAEASDDNSDAGDSVESSESVDSDTAEGADVSNAEAGTAEATAEG